MKKLILTLTLLLMALSLVACMGSLKDTEPTELSEIPSASEEAETTVPESTEEESTAEAETTEEETTEEETTSAPTETELQTEPETATPSGHEISISKDLQYRANIFLSNFSEVWFNENYEWDQATQSLKTNFTSFVTANADPADLLNFCWINIKCNNYSAIESISHETGSYYGIHIDTLNATCERYFGRTLSREEIPSGLKDEYGRYICLLIGDHVCKPAADGETYPNMTVVNKIIDLENGLYHLDFTIYSVSDVGGDDNIVAASGIIHDKSVYYFTPADAVAHPAFSYHLMGSAVVKPYVTPRGTETYQLVSYDLFNEP